MEKILNLYKELGETPLQRIERFKEANSEYRGEKMTYAGRLDPMAEGVLIVLVGEETKNRLKYTDLPKDYVFEWVFGLETDTYDVLGIPKKIISSKVEPQYRGSTLLEKTLSPGRFMQKYPPFSSKVMEGRPLFVHAKSGRMPLSALPEHEVEIKEIEYIGSCNMSDIELSSYVEKSIARVTGDFRQKEILKNWRGFFENNGKHFFTVHKARIMVSAGFYVRQFVYDIGKKMGTGALTLSILRTKVGRYEIKDSIP